MKQSDIPDKFPIPWANNAGAGFKKTIPITSQIGVVDGKASLADGWPPLNFDDVLIGGVPSSGADDNGIKNQITANIRWSANAGMIPQYDTAFSSFIGGYPKGSILQ